MSDNTREFELGAVISATTGRLVAREGFPAVHELFEFITGEPIWTHQLPRVFEECQEELYEQFPWMRNITFPDDLGPDTYIAWLDEQVTIHGATLVVKVVDPKAHKNINPISEAITMMDGTERVVVVSINDTK